MTPEQQELLDLIELLLTQIGTDKVYRHIQDKIGDHEVFMEDTVTNVVLSTKAYGIIIDMERSFKIDMERSFKFGKIIYAWKEAEAVELMAVLKEHYILDMLAGL